MKRKLVGALSVVLICSVLLLSGCTTSAGKTYMKEVYGEKENLAAQAVTYDRDLEKRNSFMLTQEKKHNNVVTVDLGEVKNFNTITLSEVGNSITRFSVYGGNNLEEDYKLIFQGDTVKDGRTCYVGDVSYRYLRIFVIESTAGFKLNDIGVYSLKNENAEKLRVTAYLLAAEIGEKSDFTMFDSLTDIILFGMAKFTPQGDIVFYDGDEQISEDVYAKNVAYLKEKIGERDINIIVDIFVPYGKTNVDINTMMSDNLDNAVKNTKALIDRYDLDGYDIDYEYPSNGKEWGYYNDFLRAMKKAMPDKLLSIATAPWALKFDKDVVEMIDRVQLMLYDGFDSHGYQSTFPYTVEGIKKTMKAGFPASKIEIGVPYYSRPTDGHEYWGSYKDFANELGKYDNLINWNGFDHEDKPMTGPQYFNSYQMIADKTAFAIDAGLGGIMIFRLELDLPYNHELSLSRAIHQTKLQKQVK